MNYTLETGPIRPPSEAASLLLRLTRNCPWNKCGFCHIYKGKEFSRRSVGEIKNDIDTVKSISDELLAGSHRSDFSMEEEYMRIAYWVNSGAKTVFLQDANSLILKTSELVEILLYLKEKFPSIERITTYARSKTISHKTLEELKDLKNAGLNRIHIGMESGSDRVLELIKKGVTAAEHISAGRKAMESGFDVSEYFMPGLGGRELSEEHALESARVLNAISPTFIRIRTTVPVPDTLLYNLMKEKKWTPMTDEEKVKELKALIENFDGKITSTFLSDHIMNLLEDLQGRLPEAKEEMLGLIDNFLGLNKEDKENFILGRRLGHYRYLSDYRKDEKILDLKGQVLSNFSSVDEAVMQILRNYI